MAFPETLTTSRLVLRRPRPSDAAAIFEEYATDSEVTRFLMWTPHASREVTQTFLAMAEDGWHTGSEHSWGVTLGDSDRVVGMIAIRPHGHKADIGYVLARRYWGQGLMAEAARAVVDTAFEDPAVHRVWAVCDIDNVPSARVMEKAGMVREGVLRAWIMHPNVSSKPRDVLVYARVRDTSGATG